MSASVLPFPPAARDLRVHVLPYHPPPTDPRVEEVWKRMERDNPRLFGGGVYNVIEIDPACARITAAYDLYKRFVVQPEVQTGITQLSVSGLTVARNSVLLGQRGHQTRIYGGMWQICPAGGIEPPGDPSALRDLTLADVAENLAREFEEEVGIDPTGRDVLPIAVVHDPVARSQDVVLRVEFDHAQDPRPKPGSGWEHLDIRWVPIADLPAFAQEHTLIAPSEALFRELGWLPEAPSSSGR